MAFFVTFSVVVAAGQELGTLLAKRFYLGKRIMEDLPPAYTFSDPQDWYISYDEFGISHFIFYHGFGASIGYAREADVLFVGNSQVGFGFRKTVLKGGELKTGLNFYNLGFGYNEGSKFALALIEKHELHPRIVVANAAMGQESNFFRPQASELGQKAMESSRWEARKTVWGWKLTWQVRHSALNEWLPNWRELRPPGRIWIPRIIYCRSISSGCWAAYREKQRPVPVGLPPADNNGELIAIDSQTLSIGWDFKRALAERGTKLVLTYVPSAHNLDQRREAEALAAALQVPFIAAVVDGLITRDGGHLDDESAKRFGDRFLADFNAWLKKSGTSNEP